MCAPCMHCCREADTSPVVCELEKEGGGGVVAPKTDGPRRATTRARRRAMMEESGMSQVIVIREGS